MSTEQQPDPGAALTLTTRSVGSGVIMFRCSHFLMLDPTLSLPFGSMLSPMPMTTLLRRLFLAGVERSAVVFPGLGAEQTLPVCPLQTLASGGRPPRLLPIQGCFEMDNRSI